MVAAHKDSAPAILFFILYFAFFLFLVVLYAQEKVSWKSRYSFILFHVTLRLAGQACGIAFSVMDWDANFTQRLNTLIAYLVLSAEGYFSLVLCAYRFLIVWQNQHIGSSNLEPHIPKGTPFLKKMNMIRQSKMGLIHWVLIIANTLIITGGSYLSAQLSKDKSPDEQKKDMDVGKALRVTGTACFLALVQVFLFFGIQTYRRQRESSLFLILFTWPFLTIRGVFGIVSVVDKDYSYYNPDVYTSDGVSTRFIVAEYVLATLMEWVSCGLLLGTYFCKGNMLGNEESEEARAEKEARRANGHGAEEGLESPQTLTGEQEGKKLVH